MPKLVDTPLRTDPCEIGAGKRGHATTQRRHDRLRAASCVALLNIWVAAFASATHAAEANNPEARKTPPAASFDCGRAMTAVEKLVCSDVRTSGLDRDLQQAYRTALASTDESGKALADEQHNWIKYTRGACLDTACLREVYAKRIAVLARNEKYIGNDEPYCTKPSGYQGDVPCGVSVQFYRDPNGHVASFNRSLAETKQSGRIIACHRLMALWDGAHVGPGRGEQVFGAYCTRQRGAQRQEVMVCSDDMTGDFRVLPVMAGEMSDAHLIDSAYGCSGD